MPSVRYFTFCSMVLQHYQQSLTVQILDAPRY